MGKETSIIYVRVSSPGQAEGESIPAQKQVCLTRLDDRGFKLAHPIFEEARSGFLPGKRVAYYEMLEFIESDRPANLIFLLHDRLSRDPGQFEDLVKLCERIHHNLVLHDIYRRRSFGILDPEAYEELAGLRKDIIDAGLQSARMRYRVGQSIKRLLEAGHFPGYAPVGYRNIIGTGKIVIDDDRAPLVIRAFNMYATEDYSLDDVWERIRREGLTVRTAKREERASVPARPISRADLWRMLKNPFYYGWFCWGKNKKLWDSRGVEGTGQPTYPPLISQDLYDRVQEVFKRNRGNRKIHTAKPFLYRGLLECRYCGCQLGGDGKPEGPYTYYACTSGKAWDDPDWYRKNLHTDKCPQKRWKEREITQAVEKALADVQFSQEAFDDLRKQVTGELVERHTAAETDLKSLRKKRTEIDNEIELSFKAKMAGKIDPDELQDYHRLRDKLKAELAEINSQVQELEGLDDGFVDEGLQTLETAQDFLNLFNKKDLKKSAGDILADHKILLKTYFRKIVVGDPLDRDPMYEYTWPPKYGPFEFHWNEPFSDLFEAGIMSRLSAETRNVPGAVLPEFSAKTKKWRGRRDSNSRPPA